MRPSDQRQRSRATTAKITVVIAIVEVTAMPYAAASCPLVWKPRTTAMQPNISSQLTSGR